MLNDDVSHFYQSISIGTPLILTAIFHFADTHIQLHRLFFVSCVSPAIVATLTTAFGRFSALAVNNARTRMRQSPLKTAFQIHQSPIDALPSAI